MLCGACRGRSRFRGHRRASRGGLCRNRPSFGEMLGNLPPGEEGGPSDAPNARCAAKLPSSPGVTPSAFKSCWLSPCKQEQGKKKPTRRVRKAQALVPEPRGRRKGRKWKRKKHAPQAAAPRRSGQRSPRPPPCIMFSQNF